MGGSVLLLCPFPSLPSYQLHAAVSQRPQWFLCIDVCSAQLFLQCWAYKLRQLVMFSLSLLFLDFKEINKINLVRLSQINFLIFIHIIKILVSKLWAHQMRYTDYKFR